MSFSELYESGIHKQNKAHLNNLIRIAIADGVLQGEEYSLITKIAKSLNVTNEAIQDIINNPDKYPITPPAGEEDRYKRIYGLLKLAYADGIIEEEEERLLQKYAIGLGFPTHKTSQIIDNTLNFVKEGMSFEDAYSQIENG